MNKDYVIKWEEKGDIIASRDGTHYFISFEEGNMIEQSLSKNIHYFYFSDRKEILKSTKVIENALYMSNKDVNDKLDELKNIDFNSRYMKVEYISPGTKFTRFEIMEI